MQIVLQIANYLFAAVVKIVIIVGERKERSDWKETSTIKTCYKRLVKRQQVGCEAVSEYKQREGPPQLSSCRQEIGAETK